MSLLAGVRERMNAGRERIQKETKEARAFLWGVSLMLLFVVATLWVALVRLLLAEGWQGGYVLSVVLATLMSVPFCALIIWALRSKKELSKE